ncbi:hypothetical protein HanXRQr2_Chr04g0183871 [Helianthus annuus]|nr:uncharacterized protein LOC110937674 isoform X1 [Helianthus annuus]XP_035844618.1 uncharacterized protein LOC110937674 isoform X1 [Helianthus annuus]XP_035844619.1 uncharacterized protein LOC110937674 isoform X1 [Helianthus annuus]KAF5811655.1 hypothetical protein HanXRQr2_Chr04g0183871 [Helianthus annuus]
MFLGHMDSMQRLRSSKELLLSDPVSELDGDEDDNEVLSRILYTASFEEFASSILTYDTIIWVSISLLLVLAWGVGVIMLLYLPMRRYVLSKELCSRELYVTPFEVVYKVSRPSYIPFCGVVNLERRIPLALAVDIIIEQGCLQAMFGIHTFRLESVAQGKASYVDELQIQGVSNPELLRKVIVKEASKAIQDSGRTWRTSVHGTAPENSTRIRSFTDGSVFRSPRNGKAIISPRPALAEQRVLSCTEVLIYKMDEVSQSVKRLEKIVEDAQAQTTNEGMKE